jgi:hypothetical protein
VNRTSAIAFAFFLNSALNAITVFTTDARHDGVILSENPREIILRKKDKTQITLNRDEILTMYDDQGNLLWTNPSIVHHDPTPDLPPEQNKIQLPPSGTGGGYKGWHIYLSGSVGVSGPNATFGKFPLGMGPDFLPGSFDICSGAAWYFQPNQAIVGGLGYASRPLLVKNINVQGAAGDGYWSLQYFDLRGGYRVHSGSWFIEAGLIAAVPVGGTALRLDTTSGTLQSHAYDVRTYGALYGTLGSYFEITGRLHALAMLRVEHGITAAVVGNTPTSTGYGGGVNSYGELTLVPIVVALQLGVGWQY